MTELIDATFEGLQPYLDDVPFALFGHSMGALLAFELARRIRRAGGPCASAAVRVSGHRAPELPRRHPAIAHLRDPEFITEICQRYGGVPDEVLRQPELLALFLPCLRADMTLIEHYTYVSTRRRWGVPALGLRWPRGITEATEAQLSEVAGADALELHPATIWWDALLHPRCAEGAYRERFAATWSISASRPSARPYRWSELAFRILSGR